MKYVLVFLMAALSYPTLAQSNSEAAEYNNDILGSQRNISRKSLKYIKVALYSDNVTKIERKREEVLGELQKAKKKVDGKDAFHGDSGLKEAMLAFLNTSINGYTNSFRSANDPWEERKKSYENLKRYYTYLEKGEDVLRQASITFNKEQSAFAERHGVTILDDEGLSEKVDLFNKANHYTRQIELIHFRTYALNQKFLMTLNEGKYQSLELIRKELLESVKRSSAELTALKPFKGDGELRLRLKESIRHYQNIANNELKTVVDLLGTKGNKLTKADASKVNKSMETVNSRTNTVYQKYFEAQRALLRKYIPEED